MKTARLSHGSALRKQILANRGRYVLLIPALVFMAVIIYYPLLRGLIMSLQDFNMGNNPTFVGLKHYKAILQDPFFWQAFRNTVILGGGCLLACFVCQLALAILLNELASPLYRRITQTVAYLPDLFSWVAVAGIWVALLAPETGAVNVALKALGLPSVAFMSNSRIIIPVYIFLTTWKTAGYGCIIFLAAIISVDSSLYEAARMDGASRLKQITHVMLPSISNTLSAVFLLNLISMFRIFDQPYVMGNPVVIDRVQTIMTYTYNLGINNFRFDYASAVAILSVALTGILLLAKSALTRWLERR